MQIKQHHIRMTIACFFLTNFTLLELSVSHSNNPLCIGSDVALSDTSPVTLSIQSIPCLKISNIPKLNPLAKVFLPNNNEKKPGYCGNLNHIKTKTPPAFLPAFPPGVPSTSTAVPYVQQQQTAKYYIPPPYLLSRPHISLSRQPNSLSRPLTSFSHPLTSVSRPPISFSHPPFSVPIRPLPSFSRPLTTLSHATISLSHPPTLLSRPPWISVYPRHCYPFPSPNTRYSHRLHYFSPSSSPPLYSINQDSGLDGKHNITPTPDIITYPPVASDSTCTPSFPSKNNPIVPVSWNKKVHKSQHSGTRMTILHHNVQSLKNKLPLFELFLHTLDSDYKHKPDVLCITETWFSKDSAPCHNIPGYINLSSFFRAQDSGGGVSIFTKDTSDLIALDLNVSPIEYSFEYSVVAARTRDLAILCIYKSTNPKSKFQDFLLKFEQVLTKLRAYKYLVVCGDFNVNLLLDTKQSSDFLSLLKMFNLTPSVSCPTRITTRTATCIDNILINFSPNILLNKDTNIFSGLGDHKHAQVIVFEVHNPKSTERVVLRTFNPQQISSFTEALSCTDFSPVYRRDNVNDQLSHFYSIFLFLFNSHFPYKLLSVGGPKRKPWITKGIIISSAKKRSLFSLGLQSNDPSLHEYYKNYCRVLQRVVREAKRKHTMSEIRSAPKQKRIKTVWNIVKAHSKYNRSKTCDTFELKRNNQTVKDPLEVANLFNDFWTNIVAQIPTPNTTSLNSSSPTSPSSSSSYSSVCSSSSSYSSLPSSASSAYNKCQNRFNME
uniref:Endonuclease/exonuclease/phosphatase domain-containing protein n=1 Tax=Cacopsylla melanoneura TaxID=428564 RepID=A0A8D9BK78_9HEMI